MAGISPGDPPGGRSARRRRRRALIAAAAALAVVFAVVMTGCGSRGSPGTQASSAPSSAGAAARQSRLTSFLTGRTYPKLLPIVRVFCAVAGRCRLPMVAAVAVTVAVNSA